MLAPSGRKRPPCDAPKRSRRALLTGCELLGAGKMASAALRTLLKAPLQDQHDTSALVDLRSRGACQVGHRLPHSQQVIECVRYSIQPGNPRRFCRKVAPASVLRCVAGCSASQEAMRGRLSAVQMPALHLRPVSMEVLIMRDGSRGSPLVMSDETSSC